MGVKNLVKFIEKYAPNAITYNKITKYENKTIGFDANLLFYKLVYAIRANGYDIIQNNINVTHIHALLLKLIAFRKYNITPVFVFDSTQPKIKYPTLNLRKETKDKMIDKYKDSKSDKGKRIYYYIKSDITDQEIDQCRELIDLFGYPIIDAKEEADGQLAQLYKAGLVDYIASDDMDILLFGGGVLLKNFTVSLNKKIQEINLQKILTESGLNQQQLIQIGILLGTDYCDTKKSSPTIAYTLLKQYKNLHLIPFVGKKCDDAFEYFKNPPVHKIKKIVFRNFDKNKLISFLEKFYFKKKYITKLGLLQPENYDESNSNN